MCSWLPVDGWLLAALGLMFGSCKNLYRINRLLHLSEDANRLKSWSKYLVQALRWGDFGAHST